MSSKRRLRKRACVGKVRYTSQTEAQIAKGKRQKAGVTGLNAYHCSRCGGYHIGHRPRVLQHL